MPLVSMRQLLDEAAKGGYGVGAFNVNNMEQIQSIMEAARETQSPVIIQASRGARAYSQDRFLYHLMIAATEIYPEIPTVLHLDHGNSVGDLQERDRYGLHQRHDGWLADARRQDAVELRIQRRRSRAKWWKWRTPRASRWKARSAAWAASKTATARAAAAWSHLTDPEQAVEFVKQTGVDALAIAIGTSHGAYKFSSKPTGETLKMERLIEIHKRLPNVHLVMHGSSSVPKDLQDIINQYGGKLKPTWGVPVEEIQLGIKNGVRKINVDTDNRLAITGAIRKVFAEKPEEFDPRDYMKPARDAMKKVVALRMTQFGQAGHSKDYKPIPMSEMAGDKKEAARLGHSTAPG